MIILGGGESCLYRIGDFRPSRIRYGGPVRRVHEPDRSYFRWTPFTCLPRHDLSEDLEREILAALPMTTVFVHLEPLEDEASFRDQSLDRTDLRGASGDAGG